MDPGIGDHYWLRIIQASQAAERYSRKLASPWWIEALTYSAGQSDHGCGESGDMLAGGRTKHIRYLTDFPRCHDH